MLPLDDPRWNELHHAYGPATEIPQLLRQLRAFPPCDEPEAQPYFDLWNALCRQGEVYPASIAAIPHIVRAISTAPDRAPHGALALVVSIALRHRRTPTAIDVPDDVLEAYGLSMGRLAAVAGAVAAKQPLSPAALRVVAAAIAVGNGQPLIAEGMLALEAKEV